MCVLYRDYVPGWITGEPWFLAEARRFYFLQNAHPAIGPTTQSSDFHMQFCRIGVSKKQCSEQRKYA